MMTRIVAIAALISLPLASYAGDEGKAPNEAPKASAAAPAKESGVADLAFANQLAEWGRSNNSPEALLAAAQIASSIPGSMNPDTKPAEQKAGTAPAGAAAAPAKGDEAAPTLDAAALQKEAQAMAAKKGDKNLSKYVDSVVKAGTTGSRGAEGGPKYNVAKVSGYGTDVYNVTFRGNELAEVAISGDGDTDLDVSVYDEYGNYIASDTTYGDTCYVSWTPRWTGPFRVEVKNNGSVYNQYVVVTN